MKKIIALSLIAVFALAGCGEKAPTEPNAKIVEYVEQIRNTTEAESAVDGASCELEVRGNSLVYRFTVDAITEATDEQKKTIEGYYDDNKKLFEAAHVFIREACPEIESIIYEYYTSNGTVFASKEFKK